VDVGQEGFQVRDGDERLGRWEQPARKIRTDGLGALRQIIHNAGI
jgi:hypothetical protein